MNSSLIQLLVLAALAVFLVLRLRSALGTRDGFENAPEIRSERAAERRAAPDQADGVDHDILDHAEEGSPTAQALAQMKAKEPSFAVGEFLQGARGAYEMIVTSFEAGNLDKIQPFLSPFVYQSFVDAVSAREDQGLTIEAEFIGVREIKLVKARYDESSSEGEVEISLVSELSYVVKNQAGEIVEGSPNEIKKQKDRWTFSRIMGTDDPNWLLVSTDG